MGLNCALLPFAGWGRAQILAHVEKRVRGRRGSRETERKPGGWEKKQKERWRAMRRESMGGETLGAGEVEKQGRRETKGQGVGRERGMEWDGRVVTGHTHRPSGGTGKARARVASMH